MNPIEEIRKKGLNEFIVYLILKSKLRGLSNEEKKLVQKIESGELKFTIKKLAELIPIKVVENTETTSFDILNKDVAELVFCELNRKFEEIRSENAEFLLEEEKPRLYTFDELIGMKEMKRDWIVEGLIPECSIVLLVGKRGSYKSLLALELAKCISLGKDFMGTFKTKKMGVLVVDEENGMDITIDRLRKMVEKGEKPMLYFMFFEGIKLEQDSWFEKFEKKLEKNRDIKVVIIDSFRRVSGIDENDAKEVSDFLTNRLRKLCLQYGLTIVLIHHYRKLRAENPADDMDEIRGSSDLANYADVVISVERPKESKSKVILKQVKCRMAREIEPLVVGVSWSDDKIRFSYLGSHTEYTNDVERCKQQILSWMDASHLTVFETKDAKKAMKSYGFSSRTTQRSLRVLVQEGRLTKIKRGVYARPNKPLTSFTTKEKEVETLNLLATGGTVIYNNTPDHTGSSACEKGTNNNMKNQSDNRDSVQPDHLDHKSNNQIVKKLSLERRRSYDLSTSLDSQTSKESTK